MGDINTDALRNLVAKSTPAPIELGVHDAIAIADEIESLRSQVEAKQAEIDSLMFEYCPDDMTPEQIAEYEKHQRKAPQQKEAPK